MKNVVVVGSQWGDEGKGKIVDWLSSEADIVVRFQGGHNAGHTLVIDKKVFKLRLLPSGIVRKGKISILGNGVVIDPWSLLNEIEEIIKYSFDKYRAKSPENIIETILAIMIINNISTSKLLIKLVFLSRVHLITGPFLPIMYV